MELPVAEIQKQRFRTGIAVCLITKRRGSRRGFPAMTVQMDRYRRKLPMMAVLMVPQRGNPV